MYFWLAIMKTMMKCALILETDCIVKILKIEPDREVINSVQATNRTGFESLLELNVHIYNETPEIGPARIFWSNSGVG